MADSHDAHLPRSVPYASRVHGCLLGGALGDSLGYLVEFDSLAEIQDRYGKAGLVDLSQAGGPVHFSDDTQMTLYTLDGLLEALEWANAGVAADEASCLWLAYLRWLKTQGVRAAPGAPEPAPRWIDAQSVLAHQRHPGKACVTALATGEMGTQARPLNPDSKGCGTVMRSAPFGLVPHVPAEAVYRMSLQAAALTHGHRCAQQAAAAFSWLIHRIVVDHVDVRTAVESARERLGREEHPDAVLVARIDAALDLSAAVAANRDGSGTQPGRAGGDPGEEPGGEPDAGCDAGAGTGPGVLAGSDLTSALGLGWVAEDALAVAVYSVLATAPTATSPVNHFLSALRLAVNHDGDSDSTGSIAGNILGAFYGEDALPPGWLAIAEAPELIRHLGSELVRLGTGEA